MSINEKQLKFLYVLAFGSMFMIGFIDGSRGPLIPGIRQSFGINYSSIGIMFAMANFGFLISTFFGGILCDRLGQKIIMIFGFIYVTLGIIGIYFSSIYGLFLFMMGFLNIGLGSVEIGVNSLASEIFVKRQALMMNLSHFFYGFGASMGPRYSGQLLRMDFEWHNIYGLILVLVGPLFIYLTFVKFPERVKHGHEEPVPLLEIIRDKRTLIFAAIVGFYVAAELGIANWFANYLTVVHKMDELQSSSYLSLFYAVFTLGRLFGGLAAEKIGYVRSVLIAMSSALLLFIGGIYLGKNFLFLVSLCGLFMSIVFPTIVIVIVNEFEKSKSGTLGTIITMGLCVNMAANWFIGKLNDMLGVRAGFASVIWFMAAFIVLIFVLEKVLKNCKENVIL